MKNIILLTFTAFLILNCSSKPVYQEFSATASPTEELSRLERDLNEATKAQANVLSPDNYEEAKEAFEDAQKSIAEQKSPKDSLHYIAKSRAYLKRSLNFTSLARSNLAEVINARNLALEADAKNLAQDEFEDAEDELLKITSDIEDNNLNRAIEDGAELQEKYREIELFSIKRQNLDQAQATIELAEKEGAEEFAPRSLAIAKKDVADFDKFLTANRHQENEIRRYTVATERSANHLLKITRDAKSGNLLTSEDMALKLEEEQGMVDSAQQRLGRSQSNLKSLTAQHSNLEDQNVINARFDAARSEFNNEEAEVYKQGNTLAIRLKGLEFPTSQANLGSENYALLAKVQKVIRDFDSSEIVIEGHTDSVGGKEANETLSLERARSVQNYLVSNQRGEPLTIEAIGYGYQKPLGSNRTASGRAQNRRVDILITPRSM
jgi:OmpA-OmpF porin, OOP family